MDIPLITIKVKLLCAAGSSKSRVSEKPGDPGSEFIPGRDLEAAIML
jgi:hypothetical protein